MSSSAPAVAPWRWKSPGRAGCSCGRRTRRASGRLTPSTPPIKAGWRRTWHRCAPDEAEIRRLRADAQALLPKRVAWYARKMGVSPAAVTITGAKTRFGSCSAQGRISFSWRLMDYPPEAIDYVVVHELAHLVHHNHSPAFYALVESVLPDYRARAALLKV